MKTITFNSNFGRFAYQVTAEIGEDVNEATTNLAIRGLADTAFRGCASEVEKALVKADLATKDTKRSEIAYSKDAVVVIEAAAATKLDSISADSKLPTMVFAVTGEHVYGESVSAMVRATTLVDSVLGTEREVPYRAILGLPDGDREAMIEKAHSMGLGIQPPKAKK